MKQRHAKKKAGFDIYDESEDEEDDDADGLGHASLFTNEKKKKIKLKLKFIFTGASFLLRLSVKVKDAIKDYVLIGLGNRTST